MGFLSKHPRCLNQTLCCKSIKQLRGSLKLNELRQQQQENDKELHLQELKSKRDELERLRNDLDRMYNDLGRAILDFDNKIQVAKAQLSIESS
jgi:hypothetical protein